MHNDVHDYGGSVFGDDDGDDEDAYGEVVTQRFFRRRARVLRVQPRHRLVVHQSALRHGLGGSRAGISCGRRSFCWGRQQR
jgi:hypothetical protein